MLTGETVEALILAALENLNAELDDARKIRIHPGTPLFGVAAEIDSLALVSLIVDIETALNSEHNCDISLTDDRAMARAESPFTDVPALKTYILELANESGA